MVIRGDNFNEFIPTFDTHLLWPELYRMWCVDRHDKFIMTDGINY